MLSQGLPAPHAAKLLSFSNTETAVWPNTLSSWKQAGFSTHCLISMINAPPNSGFQVTDANQNGSNAAIALARPDSQLFITMVDLQDGRRTEFNQVKQ